MAGTIKIRIRGHLDSRWKDWFDGLEIMQEGANTLLFGDMPDEAFVHGTLARIRDLNLTLISVDIKDASNNNQHAK